MTASNAATLPTVGRELRSLVTADGHLELSLVTVPVPTPTVGEVLVKVQAAPINPSDLGLLLAMADVAHAVVSGTADDPVVRAPIGERVMAGLRTRVGRSLPVGNEGCGVVVAAGDSPEAQGLLGRTVSFVGGASYSEYRAVATQVCMPLPDGTDPVQGASCFVNPLTALGMVETMRMEGHTALVHTAAASNLGQMLVRICQADGVPLVNIVRRPEQEALLRAIGATYVCDSSKPSFRNDLTAALVETGATLAFDAIGGGRLAGQILACMEAAANATATEYSPYGSAVHKQVYIYGALDTSPTELVRTFGMSWGVGGWLLTPFLGKLGAKGMGRLQARVVAELSTTFASHYTHQVSLAGALSLDAIHDYAKMATGQKYLIRPTDG
ncbi:MAG: zinc-binding dehydrogenase [Actinomycetota bacterium]